ncbi:MAG: hypothetical protein R3D84_05770 [Paracoccaceae bacterium]
MHRLRTLILALTAALTLAGAAAAQYYEPARGTAERAALMDTLRPLAIGYLGAPVEFVVQDPRVSGDLAMAFVMAQRPGGGQIDMAATP